MTLELDDNWGNLREAAISVMTMAQAKYSNFRVGAALEAADGRIFIGCNIENSSYPVTMCAERVALGSAVAAGVTEFQRLYVCADSEGATAPCGMCRQGLAEFAPDLHIVSEGTSGDRIEWRLFDLLPARFELDPRQQEGDA